MKLTGIELKNVRGFKELPKTEFSDSINIFIGENNSGKSTILQAIHLIQKTDALCTLDQTIGTKNGLVKLFCKGDHEPSFTADTNRLGFLFRLNDGTRNLLHANDGEAGWGSATNQSEPDNLIYPYLSKRKVAVYSTDVHKAAVLAVTGNFTYLYAKIDSLSDPQQSQYEDYIEACDNILGFRISTSGADGNGKRAVYKLHGHEEIPLTSMGEGVANLLGLIVDLCVAENRIFLIEEPENDIHPKALKALLGLIIKKSATNQFFVSTHSNIVMRTLGASGTSKVFEVSNELSDPEKPKLFVSHIKEIKTPEERRDTLESLGYEFFDYGQYAAYLFLEESSAEIIIREYLIPWYVESLVGKIRTYSAASISKIEKRFEDFNNLFIFIHLEPLYKNKAWVIIDGGESEAQIIVRLKDMYAEKNGWNEGNFSQFASHDFEEYYPIPFKERFISEIRDAGSLSKEVKRAKKLVLLNELRSWISENEDEAKTLFELTAKEVISKLKEIDSALHTKIVL